MNRRLPAVDVLRGLCIVLVVIHHINLRIRLNKSEFGALFPDLAHRFFFWSGSLSVKVFFVISGFLITSTILSRWKSLDQIDVRAFYRLRFARIAPPLLALLGILSILHLTGSPGFVINPQRASLPRALLAALTFHINWLEAKVSYLPGAWDILWSLSVEEAFYLFYPLLCRYQRNKWLLAALAVALIIAGPFARTLFAPNEIGQDYLYFANLDCIAFGCIAALVTTTRNPLPLRIAGILMLFLVFVARPLAGCLGLYRSGLDVTVAALGTCLLLIAINHSPARSGILTAPLRWYGRNSYEVYLTHMFIVTWGTRIFTMNHFSIHTAPYWFGGMLGLAGILGWAVARSFSEPLNSKLRAT